MIVGDTNTHVSGRHCAVAAGYIETHGGTLFASFTHHRHRLVQGFTRRYNLYKLVYYEVLTDMIVGRQRERQIKGLLRAKKEALVNAANPAWRDLYDELP